MKYFAGALLMFVAGLWVTHMEGTHVTLTPIVRLRTIDGMFITFVQPGRFKSGECRATVNAFTESLDKTCARCVLEAADCHEKLDGVDRALAEREAVPFHTVEAKMFRIALAGPPATVLSQCREIASQMVRLGVEGSVCREPLGSPKLQGG